MSDSDRPKQSASSWEAWVIGVLFVLALLLAGLPRVQRFIASRDVAAKQSCIANLKMIDGALQQWALENKKTATDTYSLRDPDVLAYLKGSLLPECHDHGRYLPGTNLSDSPRCTIGGFGHTL